jgi:predicted transcriptional regulator
MKKTIAEIVPTMGYASDMLSCVMVGAANKGLWLTLQAHVNIVAVAALLDLSAVIITEGAKPDAMTIAKANEQQITLLSTPESTYSIAGKLWELGLKAKNS